MAIKRLLQSWVRLRDSGLIIDGGRWGMAAVVVAVGVLSLDRQSALRHGLDRWINIHALFCLVLSAFFFMQLRKRCRRPPLRAAEVSELSRELSRLVYLFLYAVIGLRRIINIAGHIFYGEPLDFSLAGRSHKGSAVAWFDLNDDFQAFLVAGLAALIVIRVLLYGMWRRATHRTGASAASSISGDGHSIRNTLSPTAAVSVKTCSSTAK